MRRLTVALALAAHALLSAYAAQVSAHASPQQPRTHVIFVFFASGSVDVPPRFDADVREAACHVVPGVAVKIRGYADRIGSAEDNLHRSEWRAQNVLNAIGRYGAPCERLMDYKGMGEEDAPGQAEDRPFSRRVEIIMEGRLPADDAVAACKKSPPPSPAPPRCVTPR